MNKSIKILVEKLEENREGGLKGGFSAIKGGFRTFDASGADSTNGRCSNTTACGSTTNVTSCSNNAC